MLGDRHNCEFLGSQATLNNLGTVYNMPPCCKMLQERRAGARFRPKSARMRDHEKAQEYFLAAQQVAGHEEPDKDLV